VHPKNRQALEKRVIRAAEAALYHHQYVSALDVFTGMGLLTPTHVADWRKGRAGYLERVIHTNLPRITAMMAAFRRWAQQKGLRPSETRYTRRAREGTVDLRFSKSGDPAIEKSYRTHYVSPALSERKPRQIAERFDRAAKPVVFLNSNRFRKGAVCEAATSGSGGVSSRASTSDRVPVTSRVQK
jgi:hypothetical protein